MFQSSKFSENWNWKKKKIKHASEKNDKRNGIAICVAPIYGPCCMGTYQRNALENFRSDTEATFPCSYFRSFRFHLQACHIYVYFAFICSYAHPRVYFSGTPFSYAPVTTRQYMRRLLLFIQRTTVPERFWSLLKDSVQLKYGIVESC